MKKLFPNTLLQILFLFSVGLMLCLPFYYIIKTFYSNWSPDSIATVIYVLLLFFYISLVFFVNRKWQIAVVITWNWLSWSTICLIFFAIIGFRFGVEFPIFKLLSTKPALRVPESMSFIIISGALLLAPLLEEVLFRGMILKGLLTNIKPVWAVIFSALIFAVVHSSFPQMGSALFLGIACGIMFYRTASMSCVIIMHFVWNLIGVLSSVIGSDQIGIGSKTAFEISPIFLIPAAVTVFFVSLFLLLKKLKTTKVRPV